MLLLSFKVFPHYPKVIQGPTILQIFIYILRVNIFTGAIEDMIASFIIRLVMMGNWTLWVGWRKRSQGPAILL